MAPHATVAAREPVPDLGGICYLAIVGKGPKVQVVVRIPADTARRLKAKCARSGETLQAVLERLLLRYLKTPRKKKAP